MTINKYQIHYFPGTRDELVTILRETLSDFRLQHILRVENKALKLAQHYNFQDLERVSVAALVHDYAKERADEDFREVIFDKKLNQDLLNWGNYVWHGFVGAELIHDELKITDEDILNAVRRHTTGASYMTMLDKIIFMADYIEDGRDFEGIEEVRDLTFNNIDDAIIWQLSHTLQYLVTKKTSIHPQTVLTYNAFIAKKNKMVVI